MITFVTTRTRCSHLHSVSQALKAIGLHDVCNDDEIYNYKNKILYKGQSERFYKQRYGFNGFNNLGLDSIQNGASM